MRATVVGVGRGWRRPSTSDGAAAALSNLDKVLWPETGFTKGPADRLLRPDRRRSWCPTCPAGRSRLRRWPNGVDGRVFFEKNCPSHRPRPVGSTTVRMGDVSYCLLDEPATLVWTANLAAIELHPALARAGRSGVSRPPWCSTSTPARRRRAHLRPGGAADPGAPRRTSGCVCGEDVGSKGLQLYVPLNSGVDLRADQALRPRRGPGARAGPPRRWCVSDAGASSDRTGKVFIDWSQNTASKTTVAVYSVRARPAPTVSTPLTWDELEDGADARRRRPACASSPPRCSTGSAPAATCTPPVADLVAGAAPPGRGPAQNCRALSSGIPARRPGSVGPPPAVPVRPAGRTARRPLGATRRRPRRPGRPRCRWPGRPGRPAPRVVASSSGDISTGRAQASARACTKTPLALMPPSTRRWPIVEAGVVLGRLEQVGSASGRRPRARPAPPRPGPMPRVSPRRVPRAPKSHCGVPKPEQGRDSDHAAGVAAPAAATASDSAALTDQTRGRRTSQSTARAGRQHDRLDAPGESAGRAARPRSGSSRPRPRTSNARAGRPDADVEHGAGAEGGLGQSGPGAALTDQRRLLVAGHAGDRGGAPGRALASPSHAGGIDDRWGGPTSGCRGARARAVAPSRGRPGA